VNLAKQNICETEKQKEILNGLIYYVENYGENTGSSSSGRSVNLQCSFVKGKQWTSRFSETSTTETSRDFIDFTRLKPSLFLPRVS
jgi:hypothetical protein